MTTTDPLSTSIIIDTETLSLAPDAIITEIGLLAFNRADFTVIDELEIKPGLFDQLAMGRSYDSSTIEFHQRQGTLPENTSGPTPKATVASIESFILKHQPVRVWIQGPDFDRPLIEDLCRKLGTALPWKYSITRDTRTTFDLAYPGERHAPRPHTALADCRHTLADLARSLVTLNRTEAA